MVIKRVSPLSCAKVFGVLYAVMGLIFGALVSLLAMAGGMAWSAQDEPAGAVFGLLFGAGAIIVLPIFYGVCGAVFSALGALIYNVVAGLTGGIEVDVT